METVIVPDPGPGGAVVDIQACGVCATHLHYREGAITDEYPFLLGHEAAGTVAAVGAGVTNVAVGNYVIINWRAECGQVSRWASWSSTAMSTWRLSILECVSAQVIGSPAGVRTRCRRSPQK